MRVRSLDSFRGITIALMILVNQAGVADNVYWPLDHAPWAGWTPTDLVFPFFLFAVGMAMALSFKRYTGEAGRPDAALYGKVVKRAVVLFGIGLLLNGFYRYDLSTIRYLGVLQRIALCYLIASFVILNLGIAAQVGLAAVILAVYWLLMSHVPAPGCVAGVLTRECNFGAYVDRLLIPAAHLYQGDGWKGLGDPEGLFSTLPAVVSTLMGYWTGEWVRRSEPEGRISARLAAIGLAGALLGEAWGLVFPISKKIWTSSYTVLMGGLALMLFAVCYELNEVRKRTGWSWPFEVLGLNSIAVFVGSVFLIKVSVKFHASWAQGAPTLFDWVNGRWFVPWLGSYNGPTAIAVLCIVLWLAVAYGLSRHRLFIKI